MRGLLYVLTAVAVIGLGFWAYRETHRTQVAMADLRALQSEIGALREAVSVQRAEWAWLNRPDRLRMLAELNYDRLRLMPMRPDQFGEIAQIAFPAAPAPAEDPGADGAPPAAADDRDDAGAQP